MRNTGTLNSLGKRLKSIGQLKGIPAAGLKKRRLDIVEERKNANIGCLQH